MKTMIVNWSAPVLGALLLAACGAPVYKQPEMVMPAAFKESDAMATVHTGPDGTRWKRSQVAEQQPRGEWWRVFNDPALNDLVAESTRANANLAVAAARVRQARAIAGIAAADRSPQVGAGIGTERGRSPAGPLQSVNGERQAPKTAHRTLLTAAYEVDLFGRVSSNVSAAQGDAAASEATYRSVLLSLQADVAQSYFRLRATDAELGTLHELVRLREENVAINQRRFDLGDIGEFDLARARTELANARGEAIGLQRQRAMVEHALAVLLGKPPADFTAGASPLDESSLLPSIPAGIPSTLLERRPDIAAAQRAMEASDARIAEARSAMFPVLSLSAHGGGAGGTLAEALKWSTGSWALGALLSMPIVDGGRIRNNITRSEAAMEESVANYRQSVLAAFSEVEDNLAGLRVLSEQTVQIDAALLSARRSVALAQKLYDAGGTGYLDLLDAQRNLAAIERNAVQLRGDRAVTTVALIRSLGGGWDAASKQ